MDSLISRNHAHKKCVKNKQIPQNETYIACANISRSNYLIEFYLSIANEYL